MKLKDKIETALRTACHSKEMDRPLLVMEKHGYYTCNSNSHNNWLGGAAEHM